MDEGTSTSTTSPDEAEDSKPAQEGSHLPAVGRYFHIAERGSATVAEIRGGIMTFLAMVYIILLNLLTLGNIEDISDNSLGMSQVAVVTILIAGIMTTVFGLFAKYPFGIATDLGINTLVAMAFAANEGLTWGEAVSLTVLDGVVIVLLALIGFRAVVFHAVPSDMKAAMNMSIGLFIAMIGLVDGGLARRIPDAADTTVPV